MTPQPAPPQRGTTRTRLLATLALSCALNAGCSSNDQRSTQLAAGNQAVCNAAHAQNARTVYNVRNQPPDATLKKEANRIYPGSSDKTDAGAISKLKERCAEIGYHPPAR